MFDLIIKNGKIFDGTGAKPVDADIAVKDGKISELGRIAASAKQVLDARNNWVTPGFIDVQNHSDSYWTIFDEPHQESLLLQGITTVAMGNCGASLAPLPSLEALKSVQKWHTLTGVNFNWQYFDEYLSELGRQNLGVNALSLVGHSTLRRGLLGNAVRHLTPQEMKVMESLLTSSLKNGAFGLSLGLTYAHEYSSSREELLALTRLTKVHDRLLSVHLRSEASHILEAMDEILDLVKKSGVRTKISHLKVRGIKNWPRFVRLLEILDNAYAQGLPISFDVYPYTTTWSVLYTYLPKWSYEGGRRELVKRLNQPYLRKKIVDALIQQAADLSSIIVATASSAPHLVGRQLGDIAADQGVCVEEALVNIVHHTDSEIIVFEENISPEHLRQLLTHPLGMVSTDAAGFSILEGRRSQNLVHPRCFGAMARLLQITIKEKLMPPERAVFKITGMPAAVLNLKDRGVIKRGYKADITVLNPKIIKDLATLSNPYQTPLGISMVVVNGKISVHQGALTGKYGGRVVRA